MGGEAVLVVKQRIRYRRPVLASVSLLSLVPWAGPCQWGSGGAGPACPGPDTCMRAPFASRRPRPNSARCPGIAPHRGEAPFASYDAAMSAQESVHFASARWRSAPRPRSPPKPARAATLALDWIHARRTPLSPLRGRPTRRSHARPLSCPPGAAARTRRWRRAVPSHATLRHASFRAAPVHSVTMTLPSGSMLKRPGVSWHAHACVPCLALRRRPAALSGNARA